MNFQYLLQFKDEKEYSKPASTDKVLLSQLEHEKIKIIPRESIEYAPE